MVITFNTQNVNEVMEVAEVVRNILVGQSEEAVSTTEVGVEATNEVEVISEPSQEKKAVKKAPTKKAKVEEPAEEPAEETTGTVEVTLGELKETAKDAVGRSNREAVKEIIAEFGTKLTEVAEADYSALSDKLAAL